MVGGFFPTPHPDECLYSVLCRYCVHSGNTNFWSARKLIFGAVQGIASSVFFPMRLDLVEKWYGAGSGITRRYIADKHSMHPYMTVGYKGEFRQYMEGVISGANVPKLAYDHVRRCYRLLPSRLRYCPDCVSEDIASYGETYWHRVHQLPGAVYCAKHRIRLKDSAVVTKNVHMDAFHPASGECLSGKNRGEADSLKQYEEQFMKLVYESEWLLLHGSEVDWPLSLQSKYKLCLREKGLATAKCVPIGPSMTWSFKEYWGAGFLDALRSELGESEDWLQNLSGHEMASSNPLIHVLLMCFMCGSVREFIEKTPSVKVFGDGSWPCLNPMCAHYGVDDAENVGVRHVDSTAVGLFRCGACGMVYEQRLQSGILQAPSVVEYGIVWKQLLAKYLLKESFDFEAVAVLLKCTPGVVVEQLKRCFESVIGCPNVSGAVPDTKNYYRSKVMDLLSLKDDITIADMNLYTPTASRYLRIYDADWIKVHIKPK